MLLIGNHIHRSFRFNTSAAAVIVIVIAIAIDKAAIADIDIVTRSELLAI